MSPVVAWLLFLLVSIPTSLSGIAIQLENSYIKKLFYTQVLLNVTVSEFLYPKQFVS
jgi:hypothetical protein